MPASPKTRAKSQNSVVAQSPTSRHTRPGATHVANEQSVPPPQHCAPHTESLAQQVPPAQTPPSPQALPSTHAELVPPSAGAPPSRRPPSRSLFEMVAMSLQVHDEAAKKPMQTRNQARMGSV